MHKHFHFAVAILLAAGLPVLAADMVVAPVAVSPVKTSPAARAQPARPLPVSPSQDTFQRTTPLKLDAVLQAYGLTPAQVSALASQMALASNQRPMDENSQLIERVANDPNVRTQADFVEAYWGYLPKVSPILEGAGAAAFLINMPYVQAAGEKLVDPGIPGLLEKIPEGMAKRLAPLAKAMNKPGNALGAVIKKVGIEGLAEDVWFFSGFTKASFGSIVGIQNDQAGMVAANMIGALPGALVLGNAFARRRLNLPKSSSPLLNIAALLGTIGAATFTTGLIETSKAELGRDYHVHDMSLAKQIVHPRSGLSLSERGHAAADEIPSIFRDTWLSTVRGLHDISDAWHDPERRKAMLNPLDHNGSPERYAFAAVTMIPPATAGLVNATFLSRESQAVNALVKKMGPKIFTRAGVEAIKALGPRGRASAYLTGVATLVSLVATSAHDLGFLHSGVMESSKGNLFGPAGIAGAIANSLGTAFTAGNLFGGLGPFLLYAGAAGENLFAAREVDPREHTGRRIIDNAEVLEKHGLLPRSAPRTPTFGVSQLQNCTANPFKSLFKPN